MGAVPYEGDLAAYRRRRRGARIGDVGHAEECWRRCTRRRSVSCPVRWWSRSPTIDAVAHAWDLSSSVGHPIEFEARAIPAISAIVEPTCTDDVRAMGIIKAATEPPADATDTERLMAAAGRTITR